MFWNNSVVRSISEIFFVGILFLLLNGCGTTHRRYSQLNDSAPTYKIDVSKIPDATPKAEPLSKHANPTKYRVLGQTYYVSKSYVGYDQTGIASWYGMKFHNFKTSTGELYDVAGMTAAHKTLPLPCYAKVTNLNNGKQVIVKINDRGPFYENRIMDLSYAAARKLGIWPKGTGLVRVQTIEPSTWQPSESSLEVKTVPVSANPQLYMQIGAFRSRSNAENLMTRISKITSDPIHVKTMDLQGAPIYKVQIGPVKNVALSDNLFNALQREKLGTPMTVVQ